MGDSLFFEDLRVGQVWQSRGRTVTQTDVVNFACLTGDFDPLHVDQEYAAQSPFRQPIAHGLLGLAWVAGLGSNSPSVRTQAFVSVQNWEFLKPIFFGDTLHVSNEIVELNPSGRRRGQVLWRRSLINQAGEVVQKGIFETLVACREAKTPAEPADSGASLDDRRLKDGAGRLEAKSHG